MLEIQELPGRFAIHRLGPTAAVPEGLLDGGFVAAVRSPDELSVVCPEERRLPSEVADRGWSCLQVVGPLDLGATGILAGLAGVLAAAGISIFAVSAYSTDYLLVRCERLAEARAALEGAGYRLR